MQWGDDSISIPFSHSKDAQRGTNALKKLPRHCYCNPLKHSEDLASSLFDYLAMNPNVLANPNDSLFTGSLEAQSQRFGRFVKKIVQKHEHELKVRFSIMNPKDMIGVHSWRKCAHTKLNCGSTAGPTAAAAAIREGHSLGAVRDAYIAQERASDQYCGRILAGLPEHSPEFAVSYPDFIPIDVEQSCFDGVSEAEYAERQQAVDREVNHALDAIFGRDQLESFPSLRQILRIGLASHLIHVDSIERLLPVGSPYRTTPVFLDPSIRQLKEHVRIAMPWEGHYKYFAPASGLPPHVVLYAYVRGLREDWNRGNDAVLSAIESIPGKMENILDARHMIGDLSLDQIASALENRPMMQGISRDIAALKKMIEDGAFRSSNQQRPNEQIQMTPGTSERRRCNLFQHPDGKLRRVPPHWRFPSVGLQHMYQYWHCGNPSENISPMKFFDVTDVEFVGSKRARVSFYEVRKLMTLIDNRAEANGNHPLTETMTFQQAASCFLSGESAINILRATPTGRTRVKGKMMWSTVVKELRKNNAITEET